VLLVEHPGAREQIALHMAEIGQPLTPERLRMGELPQGAELIPNPVQSHSRFQPGAASFRARVSGDGLADDRVGAGYPLQCIVRHGDTEAERGMIVRGLNEGTLTPLMDRVQQRFPGSRSTVCRVSIQPSRFDYEIDLGVKGPPAMLDAAFCSQ
jgi:hypothetical protein